MGGTLFCEDRMSNNWLPIVKKQQHRSLLWKKPLGPIHITVKLSKLIPFLLFYAYQKGGRSSHLLVTPQPHLSDPALNWHCSQQGQQWHLSSKPIRRVQFSHPGPSWVPTTPSFLTFPPWPSHNRLSWFSRILNTSFISNCVLLSPASHLINRVRSINVHWTDVHKNRYHQ